MEIRNTTFDPLIQSIYGIEQQKNNNSDRQNVQSQGDTVSISAEAFALAKQQYLGQAEISEVLQEEKKNNLFALKASNDAESDSIAGAEKDDEAGALSEQFATYMYTPDGRSRNGSDGGDIEKSIKALEKKIDTLQDQLVKVSESGASGAETEVQVESINKNIEAVVAQISTLREQQSKQSEPTTTAKK